MAQALGHNRRALQPGTDLQRPPLDRVDRREITDREEVIEQGAGTPVW
jgi:hypothetical protein